MKTSPSSCRNWNWRAVPATLLSLAAVGAFVGCAQLSQQTNSPEAAAPPVADASQFPGVDQLPGKKPHQVWNGLAAKWAADHARWKPNASNDVGAVVFLGDSITEGWSTLARDFPDMKVADRGIGGDITAGVLYRLQADVLSLNPKAIVLLIGTNDLGDGSDPEDVAENIKAILEAIKHFNPHLKVIVCKVMPRGPSAQGSYMERIQKVNSLVEQYVTGKRNLAICDTWSIYADDQGNPNPADFKPDHLHLNAAGYAVWKTALDPVLVKDRLEPAKAQ